MINIEYLRSFRIFDLAIFDLVVSYLGMYLLAPFLTFLFKKIGVTVSRAQWMYLMLPISVLVHLMVSQNTTLVKQLFDLHTGYLLKIVVLLMLYKGIKG